MRLWQKIFLSTLALMALSTALVSILCCCAPAGTRCGSGRGSGR